MPAFRSGCPSTSRRPRWLSRWFWRSLRSTLEKIPIVFSGLRPGEKLFEELLADGDDTLPTAVPRLRVARLDRQAEVLDELLLVAQRPGGLADQGVRAALRHAVPGYGAVLPGASR